MPRLSDSMEEGTIVGWLKRDGDRVAKGEELVEIETDKATMIYEAEENGVLQLVADEGATVTVGEPIAFIGEAVTVAAAEGRPAASSEISAVAPHGAPQRSASLRVPNSEPSAEVRGDRVKASPLAKRIASKLGIETSGLVGTGPGGRIVKADVLAESTRARTSASPNSLPHSLEDEGRAPSPSTDIELLRPAHPAPSLPVVTPDEDSVEPLTRLQQTIATRMSASRAQIPDFTVSVDVDAGALTQLRQQLKAAATDGEPVPSVNDMIVKASALALQKHPRANSSYVDGSVVLRKQIKVGIAVAGQGTLVVPVIADADVKSLGRIALESRLLAGRARDGSITPPELTGGTFTISNLGMYGMFDCVPVVNGGQAAILGVGALRQEAVIVDGAVGIGWRIRLTLVGDHRVLYGSDAAELLATIRSTLERPLALAL